MEADAPAGGMIRAFVAVEISDDVRLELTRVQTRLQRVRARVGWVAPANIHLTLAFLGDIPPEGVAKITVELDSIGSETAPFPYRVAKLGYFGSPRSPRVIWAGVDEGAAAMTTLQQRVVEALRTLGIALETRPFTPHLTIGRVRSAQGAGELAELIEKENDRVCGVVPVTRVLLMRSALTSQGPVYSILHAAVLSAGSQESEWHVNRPPAALALPPGHRLEM